MRRSTEKWLKKDLTLKFSVTSDKFLVQKICHEEHEGHEEKQKQFLSKQING